MKQPGIDGGMSKRMPGQMGMTNTITVPSVDEYSKKIVENGGQIIVPKMAILKSRMDLQMQWILRETYLEFIEMDEKAE